jgi:hypothetical protein
MKCPHCPVVEGICLGERAERLCELAATRLDYRSLLIQRARGLAVEGMVSTPSALLAAVAACPSRGAVLSHTLQPECGCHELTECRKGRGLTPGQVTLRDCLACVSAQASTPSLLI